MTQDPNLIGPPATPEVTEGAAPVTPETAPTTPEQPATQDTSAIAPPPKVERLSVREQQVLDRVTAGNTTAEMATEFNLSVKTIEAHRARLFRKLQAKNGPHAVAIAFRMGLVQ